MKHKVDPVPFHSKKGFTLIELLIVIAVIAVIAAILFPVFAQAREAARKATCQSNLKQIGTAVLMYAQDYDETFPSAGASGPAGGDLTGLLKPYTRQPLGQGIWKCPSHSQLTPDSGWSSSYGYNWEYLLAPGPDYPHSDWNGFGNSGVSVAFLARPSETLCFMEQNAPAGKTKLWSYVNRPGDSTNHNGFGRPCFRHSNQANALFCDGHVKAVPPSSAQADQEAVHWDPR
jgi:prepilin-type N-terminal cleavage/methylation domain-containing protein/prepilin-type processing-associated H-X9-DG protein